MSSSEILPPVVENNPTSLSSEVAQATENKEHQEEKKPEVVETPADKVEDAPQDQPAPPPKEEEIESETKPPTPEIISRGYLLKRGPRPLRRWQKRYFLFQEEATPLEKFSLVYHKNFKHFKGVTDQKNQSVLQNISHATATGKGLLFYYKSDNSSDLNTPLGLINLKNIEKCEQDATVGKPNGFIIKSKSREYVLVADSPEESSFWVHTINTQTNELPDAIEDNDTYKQSLDKLVTGNAFVTGAPTPAAAPPTSESELPSASEAEHEEPIQSAPPEANTSRPQPSAIDSSHPKRKSVLAVLEGFLAKKSDKPSDKEKEAPISETSEPKETQAPEDQKKTESSDQSEQSTGDKPNSPRGNLFKIFKGKQREDIPTDDNDKLPKEDSATEEQTPTSPEDIKKDEKKSDKPLSGLFNRFLHKPSADSPVNQTSEVTSPKDTEQPEEKKDDSSESSPSKQGATGLQKTFTKIFKARSRPETTEFSQKHESKADSAKPHPDTDPEHAASDKESSLPTENPAEDKKPTGLASNFLRRLGTIARRPQSPSHSDEAPEEISPIKTGLLYKQANIVKNFEKKFVQLFPGYIVVGKNDKEIRDGKKIPLTKDTTISQVEDAKRPHSFELIISGKNHRFAAETEEDLTSWISELNSQIATIGQSPAVAEQDEPQVQTTDASPIETAPVLPKTTTDAKVSDSQDDQQDTSQPAPILPPTTVETDEKPTAES